MTNILRLILVFVSVLVIVYGDHHETTETTECSESSESSESSGSSESWDGINLNETVKIEPGIVAGGAATLGQLPYVIQVMRNGSFWCGGALISRNYVVTAAHCVTNRFNESYTEASVSEIEVRVGSIHRSSGGRVVKIQDFLVHPKYDFPEYDMAIIHLKRPIRYNKNVQKVALAKEEPPVGGQITVSGWGFVTTIGPNSQELLYTYLSALLQSHCNILFNANRETVTCGLHPAAGGICQGDSGGPAVYNDTLSGVISFTPGSCESPLPDGFSSVPVLRQWILDNTDVQD